jgi:hypothetical protein
VEAVLDGIRLQCLARMSCRSGQRDWPLPPLHALPRIDLGVARSQTHILFQGVLPFRRTDWPLPALHTFPRIDPTFISGFTVVLEGQVIRVPPPFTNYDWPVSLGHQMPLQPDRAVMSSPGINLLHRHRHRRHSSPCRVLMSVIYSKPTMWSILSLGLCSC